MILSESLVPELNTVPFPDQATTAPFPILLL